MNSAYGCPILRNYCYKNANKYCNLFPLTISKTCIGKTFKVVNYGYKIQSWLQIVQTSFLLPVFTLRVS